MDRRKEIVAAAGKSFTTFGYKATTMEQVAKIAGVGKGTIYTFFENKEELFDVIIQSLIEEMRRVADEAYTEGRSFFDNLNRVLYKLLDFREQHELALKLSAEVRDMGTPKAVEAVNRMEAAIVAYIRTKVEAAVGSGELKPCDPELTAFMMLKIYVALASDWSKQHPPLSKEQITDMFQLYFMRGLSAT